jgi:putative sigma-54 modulation protein
MQISTKATNIELTPSISSYLEKKLLVLRRFVDPADESARAEVEIERTTRHHRSGDVFRAEINMHVAGKNLRVESIKDDLYAAIDEMKDEITRELTSYKKRRITLVRKGAQKAKAILRSLYRR